MSTQMQSGQEQFSLLLVCTGNVYRSRIAHAEFRRLLQARLGADAERFVIGSAGSEAEPGRELEPNQAAALQRLGADIDLAPRRSLHPTDISRADLVLGADRTHRRAVLVLAPDALARTFTLGELARIAPSAAERIGLTTRPRHADVVLHAHRVVEMASTYRGVFRGEPTDEIADPWGEPFSKLERVATQVRQAVATSVDVLVGSLESEFLQQTSRT